MDVFGRAARRARRIAPDAAVPPRPGAPPGRLGTPEGGPAIALETIVADNLAAIAAGLVILSLGLLAVVLVLLRRVGRLASRMESLTRGSDGASLEEVLASHLDRVHEVSRSIDRVEVRTAVLERDLPKSLARVGLVRYNPFEDTGGNQSFALAVVDGRGDGFVVSSLHSRQATRMYAKSIAKGGSEAALSAEETEALRSALAQPVPGSIR